MFALRYRITKPHYATNTRIGVATDGDRSFGTGGAHGVVYNRTNMQADNRRHPPQPCLGTSRLLPLLIGILTLGIGGAITFYVHHLEVAYQTSNERSDTIQFLATLRARVEGEINANLHIAHSLVALVATYPNINQQDFSVLAAEIMTGTGTIRNIALARDNIVSHVHPLAGNEKAVGLDFRSLPEQWGAVARAMETGGTVVTGPVQLVQGGTGLIARAPVFLRPDTAGLTADGKLRYWGLASVVLDYPRFLQETGITPSMDGYRLALRDAQTDKIMLGDSTLFDATDATVQEIGLPNGKWQLAAEHVGTASDIQHSHLPTVLALLGALINSVLIALLVRARQQAHTYAMHDYLTGLPNRRLLEDRLGQLVAQAQRNTSGFGVIFVDLNGFKRINDDHGHQAGDGVLAEVAQRLLACVRSIDTVARIGGDEFVIAINGVRTVHELDPVLHKIRIALQAPLYHAGVDIAIGASMGAAHYPSEGQTLDQLLHRADQAMYNDKGAQVHVLHDRRA